MNIPQEYLTKPFHDWQLNLVTLFVVSIVAGRVYTGLRSQGGVRGILRSIWTGSATAAPAPAVRQPVDDPGKSDSSKPN